MISGRNNCREMMFPGGLSDAAIDMLEIFYPHVNNYSVVISCV